MLILMLLAFAGASSTTTYQCEDIGDVKVKLATQPSGVGTSFNYTYYCQGK